MRLTVAILAILLAGCSGGGEPGTTTDPEPQTPGVWSNAQKCEHVCAAYCAVRGRCDGTSHDQCRMELDEADGGTCAERAALFDEVEQTQVQRCIDAVAAMSCDAFEEMFDTGKGVPEACRGILS